MEGTQFIQIEVAVIGAIHTIVVAVIGWLSKRESRRTKEALYLCVEENRLSMKMQSANMDLSVATAMAVRDGKSDGVMEGALDDARRTKKEYQNFLKEIVAKVKAGKV